MDEAAVLAEADRRAQEDIRVATQRAEQAFQHAKRTEHAKLAHKLPDYFGSPQTAAKTYDELGKFLFAKGIPADRINQIHEAPIIELALAAMRIRAGPDEGFARPEVIRRKRHDGEHDRASDTNSRRPRTGLPRRQPDERRGPASGRAVQEEWRQLDRRRG